MTTQQGVGPLGADDWDHHWQAYGEAAEGNPANLYRRNLLVKLLGKTNGRSTVLDIGSGQGEFAIFLKQHLPAVDVWGVEHSATGVARAQRSAHAANVEVTFLERDLLLPVGLAANQPPATHAVCSEVLEHVEDPTLLVRNALSLLAPGCRLVVTVPGGPRSAFDKHIGHHRHFSASSLSTVLTDAGLVVDNLFRAGFPFFNLYKLAVIARGDKLIEDVENRQPNSKASQAEKLATRFFDAGFKLNRDDSPLGWQMAAVAHVPAAGR